MKTSDLSASDPIASYCFLLKPLISYIGTIENGGVHYIHAHVLVVFGGV